MYWKELEQTESSWQEAASSSSRVAWSYIKVYVFLAETHAIEKPSRYDQMLNCLLVHETKNWIVCTVFCYISNNPSL